MLHVVVSLSASSLGLSVLVAERSPSALAYELAAVRASDRRPLQQSASGTSGTYFRAPRPSEEEAATPGASRAQAGRLTFGTELLRFRPRLSTQVAKFLATEDIGHTASILKQRNLRFWL